MLADAWAKRYGRRPCELLRPHERDAEIDAALDILCLQAGIAEDIRQARNAKAMGVYVVGGG